MDQYAVEQSSLTKVANAIRGMGGTEESLEFPDGFVDAIYNLEGGGGVGLQMELLWENASPTSEFAAQTIALDLSGYDGVKIVRTEKANTEANRGANGTFHMIVDAQVSYINYEGNIQVIFLQRDYTPSDTGIIFKDCKQCGYYAGSWGKGELRNDLMKPLKIYGIKGVIE